MIRVTVEMGEGAVSRRVAITAPSMARALELSGARKSGREVRVVFPIDPEPFFVRDASLTAPSIPVSAAA